ncbi:MAG: porin [Vicinamibacterales bacterium]
MSQLFVLTRSPRRLPIRQLVTVLAALALAADVAAQERVASTSSATGIAAAVQSAGPAPATTAQASQGVTSGWSDGFVVQSATGDYRLQIGVLLHADGRFALDDEPNAVIDTFGIRRVRTNVRGRLAQHFEFYVNPDFANGTLVVQDAYLDTRFSPKFVLRVGKAKTPFGMERQQSVSNLLFFERALPSALGPNRDVGVQVLGDLAGGRVSFGAGLLNGVADGASADLDTNDGKDLAGRLAVRPFGPLSKDPRSGLTVGIAGTTGNQSGPLATIRTSSLLQNFVTYTGATADGRLTRYSPQASYYFGRVAALGEFVHTTVPVRRGAIRGEVANDAWQIGGTLMLTRGDVASERGVRPLHNADFGGGHLGALQVGARYHALTVDEDAIALGLASAGSSRSARAWTLGLNWYLTPNLKYVVNFERTTFAEPEPEFVARHPEHALAVRAQVSF